MVSAGLCVFKIIKQRMWAEKFFAEDDAVYPGVEAAMVHKLIELENNGTIDSGFKYVFCGFLVIFILD